MYLNIVLIDCSKRASHREVIYEVAQQARQKYR
jgi:hypothetical protein